MTMVRTTWRNLMIQASLCFVAMMIPGSSRAALGPQERVTDGAPRLVNGTRETQAVNGNLAATVQSVAEHSDKTEWIGYDVPPVAGEHSACCENYGDRAGCGTCRLENGNQGFSSNGNDSLKLEGGHRLAVLLRVEGHEVVRVQVASEDCTLDVGNLRFVWLTNVKASESVELLTGYVLGGHVDEREHDSLGGEALTAIALQADPAADRAFAQFVAAQQPEELRKKASFWLGQARGAAGLAMLRTMAKSDASTEVRAQVAFALSVSREPGALDEMIRMARDDRSGHVRGQALFWLAQKAGKKAVDAINDAIANDPETDVKKKAVFALSQLPKDEGVPKLIEVATTNRNAEVRKQAMFWLGQSNDPRALDFFEKVLTQ
jgi:HEAT repeat protein